MGECEQAVPSGGVFCRLSDYLAAMPTVTAGVCYFFQAHLSPPMSQRRGMMEPSRSL